MQRSRVPFVQEYKGMDVYVENVEYWWCNECDEKVFDFTDLETLTKALQTAYRKENDLLFPEEIKAIRGKLGMSQQEFETLLGVASPTVSRWETGRVIQTKTADILMRLINRFNCVQDEVKKLSGLSSPDNIDTAFAMETCMMFENDGFYSEESIEEPVISYV